MALSRTGPAWQRDQRVSTKYPVDPLSVIYNESQWKLSKVSPMYNLQYDVIKLKQYASKIRQSIVSAVVTNASVKYTVMVEASPNLKYSEEDSDGIIIEVAVVQDSTGKTKQVYTAILISWGASIKLSEATHLPYLLERGEQKIGTAVKHTLQTVFDCNIKQFCFTQSHLLQLGLNFLEIDPSRETEPFTLVYKTPQVDHKDKLTLSFEIGDVRMIWNGVKEEATKPSEELNFAYQILQNQINSMISLDISVFDLSAVILPKAEVKSEGLVKLKTPESINCVFTVLNEICDVQVKELMDIST